ncbi:MAG: ribosome maturation factor RimM [Candidatus Eisenbacteria bacterium]
MVDRPATAPTGRPARVEVGRIVKPHGLRGELVVSGVRLDPDEFRALGTVEAVRADGSRRSLDVVSARPFMQSLLARFAGVEDVDQARELHGQVLEIDPACLPPPGDGTVYLFQMLGLVVRTDAGEELGRVAEVLQTGATPVLVVRGDPTPEGARGRERMIPMSPDALRSVDTALGEVIVHLLPGMEDL